MRPAHLAPRRLAVAAMDSVLSSVASYRSGENASQVKKNSNYFGTLTWDGFDYNITQLLDIPRQAVLKVGDTIITGGMSSIFPEGIPIGRVDNIVNGASIKRIINIQLFNDMSSLKNIYVVKDFDKQQLMNLEKTDNE